MLNGHYSLFRYFTFSFFCKIIQQQYFFFDFITFFFVCFASMLSFCHKVNKCLSLVFHTIQICILYVSLCVWVFLYTIYKHWLTLISWCGIELGFTIQYNISSSIMSLQVHTVYLCIVQVKVKLCDEGGVVSLVRLMPISSNLQLINR